VQVAKIAAERLVAFHVERLIAKEQNLMLRQRLVQLLDLTRKVTARGSLRPRPSVHASSW
jgi:hypothetical protein